MNRQVQSGSIRIGLAAPYHFSEAFLSSDSLERSLSLPREIIPPAWPSLNILNEMETGNNHSFAFSLRFGQLVQATNRKPHPAKPGSEFPRL
jgi:hypothetical protein